MATATQSRTTRARTAKKAAKKTTRAAKTTATKATKRAPAKRTPATKRAATKATKTTKRAATKATKTTKRAATKAVKTTKRAVKKSAPAAKKRTGSPRARQDALAVLKDDHRQVEALFKRFERAGDAAHRTKRQLVDNMIEALSRHAGIEEHVFYPAVRRDVARAASSVLEALEEHHVAKLLLNELEDLDARAERFDAKVTVLIESVRHHVREEERSLFPKVRDKIGRTRLLELGDELRAAKPRVPTRPHPLGPDEPPTNIILDSATAAMDRARSVGKRAVDRVRSELPGT